MRILIDADGCPVVEETIEVAKAFGCETWIVCDTAHYFEQRDGVRVIYCDTGKDHVDFEILRQLTSNDILITQDYGLASLALVRQAHVLNQNGMRYTLDNIDQLLQQRSDHAKLRKMKVRTPHAKKRSSQADDDFIDALTTLIEEVGYGRS